MDKVMMEISLKILTEIKKAKREGRSPKIEMLNQELQAYMNAVEGR